MSCTLCILLVCVLCMQSVPLPVTTLTQASTALSEQWQRQRRRQGKGEGSSRRRAGTDVLLLQEGRAPEGEVQETHRRPREGRGETDRSSAAGARRLRVSSTAQVAARSHRHGGQSKPSADAEAPQPASKKKINSDDFWARCGIVCCPAPEVNEQAGQG